MGPFFFSFLHFKVPTDAFKGGQQTDMLWCFITRLNSCLECWCLCPFARHVFIICFNAVYQNPLIPTDEGIADRR